jgi:hypothetical protein
VRFGSLDKRDGEHYLNVAITRAREQIIVVSSFDPRRIDAENARHDCTRRFKDYLCFAKAISEHNIEEAKKILSSLNSNQYENVDKLDNAEGDSLELCSKGYSQREVSLVLQVGLAKVNTDISHLIDEARLQFLYSVKSKSIILAYTK